MAVELAAKELAVEADVFVMARVGGDAVEVAIVVAEYDVDGPGKSAAQLVDHEGRAEIAAAQQYIGIAHRGQRGVEFPDVIVDVGEDGDSHEWRSVPLMIILLPMTASIQLASRKL